MDVPEKGSRWVSRDHRNHKAPYLVVRYIGQESVVCDRFKDPARTKAAGQVAVQLSAFSDACAPDAA